MDTFRYPTPEGFDDLLMCTDGEALTGLWFEGSHDENQYASGIVAITTLYNLAEEHPPSPLRQELSTYMPLYSYSFLG